MATIDFQLQEETTHTRHWQWQARLFMQGKIVTLQISLNFADYANWCHGNCPPSDIARKVLRFSLASGHLPEPLPKRLDCAQLSRLIPGLADHLKLPDPN